VWLRSRRTGTAVAAAIATSENTATAVAKAARGRSPRSASPSTPSSSETHRMKSGFRSVSRSTEEKNMPADVAGGFLQRYAVTIGTTITVLGFLVGWRALFATENA
jgi:hypothetical protein